VIREHAVTLAEMTLACGTVCRLWLKIRKLYARALALLPVEESDHRYLIRVRRVNLTP
jgi:hypothetical protein